MEGGRSFQRNDDCEGAIHEVATRARHSGRSDSTTGRPIRPRPHPGIRRRLRASRPHGYGLAMPGPQQLAAVPRTLKSLESRRALYVRTGDRAGGWTR